MLSALASAALSDAGIRSDSCQDADLPRPDAALAELRKEGFEGPKLREAQHEAGKFSKEQAPNPAPRRRQIPTGGLASRRRAMAGSRRSIAITSGSFDAQARSPLLEERSQPLPRLRTRRGEGSNDGFDEESVVLRHVLDARERVDDGVVRQRRVAGGDCCESPSPCRAPRRARQILDEVEALGLLRRSAPVPSA